ncbi:MAG TPA: hypothetical protein VH913_02045, partial [Hyphomicrobiaceae bacterium]
GLRDADAACQLRHAADCTNSLIQSLISHRSACVSPPAQKAPSQPNWTAKQTSIASGYRYFFAVAPLGILIAIGTPLMRDIRYQVQAQLPGAMAWRVS